MGCAIQTCPDKVQAANPLRYVTAADPPMMILHGGSDPLVPHNQGEQLYMALNKACLESVFISLPEGRARTVEWLPDRRRDPRSGDDPLDERGRMPVVNPTPFTPSWKTVIEFLDKHLQGSATAASR